MFLDILTRNRIRVIYKMIVIDLFRVLKIQSHIYSSFSPLSFVDEFYCVLIFYLLNLIPTFIAKIDVLYSEDDRHQQDGLKHTKIHLSQF